MACTESETSSQSWHTNSCHPRVSVLLPCHNTNVYSRGNDSRVARADPANGWLPRSNPSSSTLLMTARCCQHPTRVKMHHTEGKISPSSMIWPGLSPTQAPDPTAQIYLVPLRQTLSTIRVTTIRPCVARQNHQGRPSKSLQRKNNLPCFPP